MDFIQCSIISPVQKILHKLNNKVAFMRTYIARRSKRNDTPLRDNLTCTGGRPMYSCILWASDSYQSLGTNRVMKNALEIRERNQKWDIEFSDQLTLHSRSHSIAWSEPKIKLSVNIWSIDRIPRNKSPNWTLRHSHSTMDFRRFVIRRTTWSATLPHDQMPSWWG